MYDCEGAEKDIFQVVSFTYNCREAVVQYLVHWMVVPEVRGLGLSPGLAVPLSTLLRIVGQPCQMLRVVPKVICDGLAFHPGNLEIVVVFSFF